MNKIGMVAGRFQPFHNGHLSIVHQMLRECKEVVIVIGSAQMSYWPNNPFTAGERYQMIRNTFDEEHLAKMHIIPVQDINRYDIWFKHVESLTPPFDVVYTRSPFMQQLAKDAGYEVVVPDAKTVKVAGWIKNPEDRQKRISATDVRELMVNDTSWKEYVPQGTIDVIEKINGIERIQMISKKDI